MNDKQIKSNQVKMQNEIKKIDPSTLPSRVANLESAKHTHGNYGTLEKLSEEHIAVLDRLAVNENGKLTLDGVEV